MNHIQIQLFIEMVKADGLDTGLYELQLLEQKKLLTQKQGIVKFRRNGVLPDLSYIQR